MQDFFHFLSSPALLLTTQPPAVTATAAAAPHQHNDSYSRRKGKKNKIEMKKCIFWVMIEIGVVSVDNHQQNSITTIRERKNSWGWAVCIHGWLLKSLAKTTTTEKFRKKNLEQ